MHTRVELCMAGMTRKMSSCQPALAWPPPSQEGAALSGKVCWKRAVQGAALLPSFLSPKRDLHPYTNPEPKPWTGAAARGLAAGAGAAAVRRQRRRLRHAHRRHAGHAAHRARQHAGL